MNLGLKSCCRPKADGKPADPEQHQHPDRKGQTRGCHSLRLQRAPLSPLFLPPLSPTHGPLGSAPSLPRAGLRPGSAGAPSCPSPRAGRRHRSSRLREPPGFRSPRAAVLQPGSFSPGGPHLPFSPLALPVPLRWLAVAACPVLGAAGDGGRGRRQGTAAGHPQLTADWSVEFCSQPCSRTCPGPRLRQDRGQPFPCPTPGPPAGRRHSPGSRARGEPEPPARRCPLCWEGLGEAALRWEEWA